MKSIMDCPRLQGSLGHAVGRHQPGEKIMAKEATAHCGAAGPALAAPASVLDVELGP
jgi:hypothetical protein